MEPAARTPRSYPRAWEAMVTLPDGVIVDIRPLRVGDAVLYPAFFQHINARDMRFRFFGAMREATPALIADLTRVDYASAIVLLAINHANGELLGVVRAHMDKTPESAEFAILTRSDYHGHGLGWALMTHCVDIARREGLRNIYGQVMAENHAMLELCRELGFEIHADPSDAEIRNVLLDLRVGSNINTLSRRESASNSHH